MQRVATSPNLQIDLKMTSMSMKTMLRGQVWLYNSDPTIGDEIGKTRSAVIVSNNELGVLRLKVIAPITGWNEAFTSAEWMVKIEPTNDNELSKRSAVDTFQVRSGSQQRLIKQVGTLSDEMMDEVSKALSIVLDIGN
jgi:mRNA interferase MazF